MKDENWRQEIVQINEALQHLTKQKDKSNKALEKFQKRGHESALITKSLAAFTLDPEQEKKKNVSETKSDSIKAQELALEIEANILGNNLLSDMISKRYGYGDSNTG